MFNQCKEIQDELVRMRRDLHKIPELGFDLPLTQKYVTDKLNEYGVEYKLNEGDSGIIAYINKGKPGKVIALRADMDALPIKEETGVEYCSTHDGKMHACGHDAHTSMLLGTAKILNANKDKLNGEVRLLFQTGEEIAKGAPIMIKNNAMEGVNAVFGTHIGTILDRTIPAGKFIVCPGAVMASFDRFVITINGTGCHGSTPEKGVDPINIAAHVVLGLEGIVAREFNANEPVVITIGKIQGGAQYNIIPGTVVIEGTTRAFKEENRQKMAKRIEEVSKFTAQAFGGNVDFFMDWGAPPVVNDKEMADFAGKCAIEVLGTEKVITRVNAPNMGGEDFAFYLGKAPGAFMFLSSANPDKKADFPHHNPVFNIDEDVLWEGTAIFVKIASEFLK
ncbi:MAG: amidohydrolase [Synergistaceae bacterium]|nr:amidohydrolase [Synergistaceae bacterium]